MKAFQKGRLGKLTPQLEKDLLLTAQQVDAGRELVKSIEGQNAAREKNLAMMFKMDEAALAEVDKLFEGNQALREEIELIGLDTAARATLEKARVSSAIALKEEQLIGLQNAAASATQISALEREISLLKQRSVLLGQKETRLIADEEFKRSEEFASELNKDLKSAFQDAFRATGDPIKAFGESLYSTVSSRISAAISEFLADSILDSIGLGSKKKPGSGGTNYLDLLGSIGRLPNAASVGVMNEKELGDSFAKSLEVAQFV